MSVSTAVKALNPATATAAYLDANPDFTRTVVVSANGSAHLLPTDPLRAGSAMHRSLLLMCHDNELTGVEKAFYPWIAALRKEIWKLGAHKMDIEAKLESIGNVPAGVADLLVYGGPRRTGTIEIKTFTKGRHLRPSGRATAQSAAYARLNAGHGSFDDIWFGTAHVELETRVVRLFVYTNTVRPMIMRTIALLNAA